MESAVKQYQLVLESREVIFQFCDSFSNSDYFRTVENFGQGSIRNTQAHIVDSYIHWIANYALNKSLSYLQAESISTVDMMREEYRKVNNWISEFLEKYDHQPDSILINQQRKRGKVQTTPLTLFTHMITHEFHHKGQLVSMARTLGYQSPDTDIIRL